MITFQTLIPLDPWVNGKTRDPSASGLDPDAGITDFGRADELVEGDLMGLRDRKEQFELGLRWPDSSRDRVLLEMPVSAASWVRGTLRWVRIFLRRGPTSARTVVSVGASSIAANASSKFPETATKVGGRALAPHPPAMDTPLSDVVVIGGGAAGLSAALVLGRARRRVAVIDSGSPRTPPRHTCTGFSRGTAFRPAS